MLELALWVCVYTACGALGAAIFYGWELISSRSEDGS